MTSLPRARILAVALVAAPAFASPVLGAMPEGLEQLVQRGLHELHADDLRATLETSAEMRRLWPEHPAGYLSAANAYQTAMRDYRVRIYEREFEAMLGKAFDLARLHASTNPTPEMVFTLGSARGYRALHKARTGSWFAAFREGSRSIGDMERAVALDPSFVDPLLPMAVYDYWKSQKLSLGIGLFSGRRKLALRRLELVKSQGRYVSVDAAYALMAIHYQQDDDARALELNDGLHQRFPKNPVCLYYRALLCERLGRPGEALELWERVMERIRAAEKVSDGWLAECYLARARLQEALDPDRGSGGGRRGGIVEALKRAAAHARGRVPQAEMEGVIVSSREVNRSIRQMLKKYDIPASGVRVIE